jgi:hypothetical protein
MIRQSGFLLALLLGVLSARATVVPRFSLEALAADAEHIVHARAIRSWVAWDRDRAYIWTHTEFAVTEALKGGSSTRLVVSEPGGALDGLVLQVEGAPRLADGEEVVLFVHRTPSYRRTLGYGQGKFTVERMANEATRVRSTAAGLVLADPAGKAAPLRTAATADGMELTAFKSLVRRLVSQSGGAR